MNTIFINKPILSINSLLYLLSKLYHTVILVNVNYLTDYKSSYINHVVPYAIFRFDLI